MPGSRKVEDQWRAPSSGKEKGHPLKMRHARSVESRLKPAVTVAASRSGSVVRPGASSLPASEARAASALVAAVQTAFPQGGCGQAAYARSEEASAAVARAHSGWAPADCSAVPTADEWISAGHSAVL